MKRWPAPKAAVEQAVTRYLETMRFLWLSVDDEPGPQSLRGVIERNAIALLSNYGRTPSLRRHPAGWAVPLIARLVRGSGLWNQRHVEETHDPAFLDVFEIMIAQTGTGN